MPRKFLLLFLLFTALFALSFTHPSIPPTHSVYASLVVKGGDGIRGVQVRHGASVLDRDTLNYVHPSWVKVHLDWQYVEANPGIYTWLPELDADLDFYHTARYKIILELIQAPPWAREIPDLPCSRIRADAIPAFAEFAKQVVLRYPYIDAVEIWNEPDYEYLGGDSNYGCWGDHTQPYFGGAYYATVINPVYAAIHSVTNRPIVYFGGLMLPNTGPQSAYFEGAVQAGAQFDGVSFHHYDWYSTGYTSLEWQANLLRAAMLQYNRMRPLILSETSLLYAGTDIKYEQAQANYIFFIHNEALQLGLNAVIWYTLHDSYWYHSGMKDGERCKLICNTFRVNQEFP